MCCLNLDSGSDPSLNQLGLVFKAKGEYEEAARLFGESLAELRESARSRNVGASNMQSVQWSKI
jgi:hypothetical protein